MHNISWISRHHPKNKHASAWFPGTKVNVVWLGISQGRIIFSTPPPRTKSAFYPTPSSASKAILSRVQLTLHATRRTPLTPLRAWCKQCLPGRSKPDMLRPGIVGMRGGSMAIRLRPCMRSSASLLSSTPPPPPPGSWFPECRKSPQQKPKGYCLLLESGSLLLVYGT